MSHYVYCLFHSSTGNLLLNRCEQTVILSWCIFLLYLLKFMIRELWLAFLLKMLITLLYLDISLLKVIDIYNLISSSTRCPIRVRVPSPRQGAFCLWYVGTITVFDPSVRSPNVPTPPINFPICTMSIQQHCLPKNSITRPRAVFSARWKRKSPWN